MKATILTLVSVIIISVSVSAQKKNTTISKQKIWPLECEYEKVENLDLNTTFYYVYISFQNGKYRNIIDLKHIYLTSQADVDNFKKDLRSALSEMGTKTSISWSRELYSIDLYDFANKMYLHEKPSEGNGYALISKKNVKKLIEWLDGVQLKSN